MKKLLTILCLCLVVAVPHAAAAEPGAYVVRQASALITGKTHHGMVNIRGVFMRVRTYASETTATYSVFNGFCLEGSTNTDECMISSNGFKGGDLEEDQYEIAPDASSASINVTVGRRTYDVAWTASGEATPMAFEAYCEDGPMFGAGMTRDADVTATIAGKAVDPERVLAHTDLLTYAGECTGVSARSTRQAVERSVFGTTRHL